MRRKAVQSTHDFGHVILVRAHLRTGILYSLKKLLPPQAGVTRLPGRTPLSRRQLSSKHAHDAFGPYVATQRRRHDL
eukprot:109798-Pleurochrysis_carterae.AAC.1